MNVACALGTPLFSLAVLAASASAQPFAASDWTESAGPNGSKVFTHKSQSAVVMVGGGGADGPSLDADIVRFSADMIKSGNCPGTGKPQSILNGQARQLNLDAATMNCTFVVGRHENAKFGIIALEQAGSVAGARALAGRFAAGFVGSQVGEAAGGGAVAREQRRPETAIGANGRALPPQGLIGMWRADWVENRFNAFTGLSLTSQNSTLILTRGGYFFAAVPSGAGFDDASAIAQARSAPGTAGRYRISGNSITLDFADGTSKTAQLSRGGGGNSISFDGRALVPKLTFPDGASLTGSFSSRRISNAGSGVFALGEDDLSFSADGRFAKGGRVIVSTPARSEFGQRSGGGGGYRIQGGALYLEYHNGKQEVFSIFQEDAKTGIFLNNNWFQPVR